jgi:hypothetical protein
MKETTLTIFLFSTVVASLSAGQQQEKFIDAVQYADAVKIERASQREAGGAIFWTVLFESNDRRKVEAVASVIDMEDAKPVKTSDGRDAMQASWLTTGVPDYAIAFTRGGTTILEYWLEASPTTITPAVPRTAGGPYILVDLPLTPKGIKGIRHLISSLEKMPNQSTDPTSASGTPPAGQESRLP